MIRRNNLRWYFEYTTYYILQGILECPYTRDSIETWDAKYGINYSGRHSSCNIVKKG